MTDAVSMQPADPNQPDDLHGAVPDAEAASPTLPPHQYPAWVCLIGLAIVAALVVALIQLPPYYRAAKLLRLGEVSAEEGRHGSAVEAFRSALELTPSSRRVRIGLAVSYFKSQKDADHKKGLEAVQGMILEYSERLRLLDAAPPGYVHLLPDIKK